MSEYDNKYLMNHSSAIKWQIGLHHSEILILGIKPCPLNNVIANTNTNILILNVQLILQQLQFFQVVLVHL